MQARHMSGRKRPAILLALGLPMMMAVLAWTTGLATAHGGDSSEVHACVVPASGTIRVIEPGDSCGKNETAIDWTRNGAAYTAGFGLALNGNVFSVTGAPWAGLTGVPAGFADGLDDDGSSHVGQLRSDLAAGSPGLIDGSSIKRGTITAAALAGSDAAGTEVAGAVTSEKIFDGTIAARDIGAGAVTTASQTSNASTGAPDAAPIPAGSTQAVGLTVLSVPTTGSSHKVLVTGQAVLRCVTCDPATLEQVAVTYSVTDQSEATASPVVAVTVGGHSDIVLPVSFVMQAGPGVHGYRLRVTTGNEDVSVQSAILNAVDLGRVP